MVQVIATEEEVLRQPSERTQKLIERLKRMRDTNEEEYTARTANKLGLPYVDLHIVPLSSDDIFAIPENTARTLDLICFSKRGKLVRVGTPHPENPDVSTYLERIASEKGWDIELTVISPSSLMRGFRQYEHVYLVDTLANLRMSLTGEELAAFEENLGKIEKLQSQADALSTTEILHIIFSGAVAFGASDVHIEPQKDAIRLRYRIDGVLQDVVSIPYTVYRTIVARIKLMSRMKINVRDRAQDGRFSFTAGEKKVDVRSSTIPSKNAEGIVLRILNNDGILQSLESLGIMGKAYKDLKKTLEKNDGIILTTGPTGSGKTTTLYTIINHINDPGTKVITIENPIEYEFDGIVQTEVSKSRDYTFAKALRAIVRQDPDVILVGEIRDEETADIAINAALTGHLVLSTLHTNSAPATVARLMELGVRPNLIPPATDIFLAQRLVRRLCTCKERHVPAQEVADNILRMITMISPKAELDVPTEITELYKPVGCAACHGTGYKGRIGIFEALTITEQIEKHIIELAGETEIMKSALEDGYVTMAQDGILKALDGITSIEEVWRVTSESQIIAELYDKLMSQTLARRLFIGTDHQGAAASHAASLDQMSETIASSEASDLLATVFAFGLSLRASDIHIEPGETAAEIRVRIDGVLQTIGRITLPQHQHTLAQIKNLSGIPTTVRQGVTDSRFGIAYERTEHDDEKMDVRVSIIVGGFGETVVMRILGHDEIDLDVAKLGITPYNLERILHETRKPYGMVLNTGPTGSGKTTTLYSVLNTLKDARVKIITIEDPIEYQLSGILQTQVDKENGYTFAKALRALLRQDPDIILVGEIRDEETAATAVNAALTGHLIISTLHTNNAVGAIQRFLNLSVRPSDITTSVNSIVAQRLVRKLCSCKVPLTEIDERTQQQIQSALASISERTQVPRPERITLYGPGSCETCNGIGFKGRTVVSEVLVLDDDIRALIARGALLSEIADAAVQSGMLTMQQDGVLKALAGETTFEEVQRVTMV